MATAEARAAGGRAREACEIAESFGTWLGEVANKKVDTVTRYSRFVRQMLLPEVTEKSLDDALAHLTSEQYYNMAAEMYDDKNQHTGCLKLLKEFVRCRNKRRADEAPPVEPVALPPTPRHIPYGPRATHRTGRTRGET